MERWAGGERDREMVDRQRERQKVFLSKNQNCIPTIFLKNLQKFFVLFFSPVFRFIYFVFVFCSFCFCFSSKVAGVRYIHRHLRNIDCLMARTACLVCFSGSVNSRSKRKRKEA
jgi:hypothetical protein